MNKEELMWIYNALCDYDKHHAKNLNEQSIKSLRNLIHKVQEIRVAEEPRKGWGFPANSRKAHYFIDGRSLCGKWAFFGNLEDSNDDSPYDCTACKKALQKEKAKAKLTELKEKGKIEF